jgi:2-polyprenyl-3-methyl-5-hydroxy-6-metoxy-1,4-benzoquinol methylase
MSSRSRLIWRAAWRGLSRSWIYRAFTRIAGRYGFRHIYVSDWIKARDGDRILDIGCGPGDILAYLPRVSYVGFDINPENIRAAEARFGDRGRFFASEASRETIRRLGEFDIVTATGLLHHLDDAQCIELLEITRAALRATGRWITMDGVLTEKQSRIARYLVAHDRGRHVRTTEEYLRLARAVFPNATASVLDGLLRIPYTLIIMQGSKT